MGLGAATWAKMLGSGALLCIGGPYLVYYVTPTEEELFQRYNPDLQRRSLENRKEKQENFNDFVTSLKRHSKSDVPIWTAWDRESEERRQAGIAQTIADQKAAADAAEARRREIRGSAS
ncbi:hypothetical protein AAFC00_003683 [Neodothiora populina]|uniref:Cytochrome b mRNA-processing protein 4 n=1 Tax=Neodothiora populina TaxID=2781224 RepID=A0ABR3PF14_9PEZI